MFVNIFQEFPKISKDVRRFPKAAKDFRGRPGDVSMIQQRIGSLGGACSDEDVILEAPSYANIFLFLLVVFGVFRSLYNSKKKIQSQHNLQSFGCVTCRKTSQRIQLPRCDKSRRRISSSGRFEPI